MKHPHHDSIYLMRDYMKDLNKESGYTFLDMDKNTEIWEKFLKTKDENIMTFRDITYKSSLTGI